MEEFFHFFLWSCVIFEKVAEERGKNFQKNHIEIMREWENGKLKCDNSFNISEHSNSF